MKRLAWILVAVVLLGVAGGASFWWWRNNAERAALERTLVSAEHAADESRWREARAILTDQARRHGRPEETTAAQRWELVEFQAAGGLRDFAALEALAARHVELVAKDETAALWLWRIRRTEGNDHDAETVRAAWRGRETQTTNWICAEIDALLVEGKIDAAREQLAGLPEDQAKAVPILLRRLLIDADPTKRFEAITEAYRQAPADPDLRSLRAALLERSGQPEYARVDYVAALMADRDNPLRRDDLASFYLRQGDLGNAVQTWREGLDETSPDFMWVRAIFWGKVYGVPPPPEGTTKLPPQRLERFAGWLATLPPDRYWDEAAYQALHLPGAHAEREPAVFWLRVLEELRGDKWSELEAILAQAPSASVAQAPRLYAALRLTAAIRDGAEPAATGIAWPRMPPGAHRWWSVISDALKADAAASAEVVAVARGDLAASAACLAAGWTGPAIVLADPEEAAIASTPGWIRFGLVQARRISRGPADALAWAETLPAYPETDYVRAALRLGAGRTQEAERDLRTLASRADETGFAAGWLLGTWLIEQNRANEIGALMASAPSFATTVEGTALRARAAASQGAADEAASIYMPIAERSLEAGAFLARRALAAGDLARARELTEYWAQRLPDNLQLRANLNAITERELAAAEANP